MLTANCPPRISLVIISPLEFNHGHSNDSRHYVPGRTAAPAAILLRPDFSRTTSNQDLHHSPTGWPAIQLLVSSMTRTTSCGFAPPTVFPDLMVTVSPTTARRRRCHSVMSTTYWRHARAPN